ncbi:hypothetical protein NKH85_33290 [Mesorhizobium sp. M0924]|uniref:hypothetical protein n=1 Tax=unclassified Mesorhizobium TaxID=325217 RepID=UPI00333B8BEA
MSAGRQDDWLFREHLTQASAVDNLFARFNKHLGKAGNLAMGGQIVDAAIVAAREGRSTTALGHADSETTGMGEIEDAIDQA